MMSLNTLFGIFWQNDWEGIVYMYELAYGSTGGVLLYFITFMEMANLIFMNIIIAFVIDTYQSLDETLQAEQEAKAMKGGKKSKHSPSDDDRSLLQELNNNPIQFLRIMEILEKHSQTGDGQSNSGSFTKRNKRLSNVNGFYPGSTFISNIAEEDEESSSQNSSSGSGKDKQDDESSFGTDSDEEAADGEEKKEADKG